MNIGLVKSLVVLAVGFVGGVAVSNIPFAHATSAATPASESAASDLSQRKFLVSIDEIQQNYVFGEEFTGTYKRNVKMSDGSERVIELTPMLHDGMQVVELKDTGGLTYMGLNGTTTNDTLMIQLRDVEEMRAQMKKHGWNMPSGK